MTAVTSQTEKLHSRFSIEDILRKEESKKASLDSSKRSLSPSFSDHSLREDTQTALEKWKKEYLESYKRDCCSTKPITSTTSAAARDDIPVLESSRHRLTEHWVYENHIQRLRNIPTLRPHTAAPFPPVLPSKRPMTYSSSSDLDLIPSPSPTTTWSPPPPPPAKRQSLDYWFVDRMMRDSHHHSSYSAAGLPRRSYSDSVHPFRYYWGSSLHDERDVFPGLLGRSARLKASLGLDDDDSDEGNRKGGQVRFTHTQSTELERVFSLQKYVSPQERKQLARSIDLSERQVKTWFQNRRAKWRRIKLEDEMRARMANDSNTPNNRKESTSDANRIDSSGSPSTLTTKLDIDSESSDYRLQYRVREDARIC